MTFTTANTAHLFPDAPPPVREAPPPLLLAPPLVPPAFAPGQVTFFATGCPVAQPRPRARVMYRGGKATADVYNPADANGWKSVIRRAAAPFRPAVLFNGPVDVFTAFYFPRDTERLKHRKAPSGPIRHLVKPDADNLIKAVWDALADAGFWRDDCRISDTKIVKRYVALTGGETAVGALVVITPLGGQS